MSVSTNWLFWRLHVYGITAYLLTWWKLDGVLGTAKSLWFWIGALAFQAVVDAVVLMARGIPASPDEPGGSQGRAG